MKMEHTEFGRIEVFSVPLPESLGSDVTGTYTCSGRVLVAVREPDKGKDWYRVFTIEDDETGICELFSGEIPQKPGANGIRWMCYADNRRVLLGDYVLECSPDLDHCENSRLINVVFPAEISRIPGIFMRWSEPIIAPDNEHICFSSLTASGAFNFLGKLVRGENEYRIEDAVVVSTVHGYRPDPDHPGCYLKNVQRGGEVKQFVRGGRGITLAGGGKSISESRLQMLDSEEVFCLTDTLGYEETAILSPSEQYAICMSPRFSPKTDMGILGVVPLTGDLPTRGRYLNVLYQYAIAGVRFHRSGNIGPALIDVERSIKEGRAYQGVNLSDPEDRWVYYSPMSWNPDSTKALWNERTRLCDGNVRCRLRVCRLLDKQPSEAVPVRNTPDGKDIPYAEPLSAALSTDATRYPITVHGKTGAVVNKPTEDGYFETRYDHYSEDGETFYDGYIRVKAPDNMFCPGETTIRSDLQVSGAHKGKMNLSLVLQSDERFQIYPDLNQSYGFAEYDGLRREVKDISC